MKDAVNPHVGPVETFVATNAKSSGISVDRARLKALMYRSDRPGLMFLAQWAGLLVATGSVVWLTTSTIWVWPAIVIYGSVICVPAYALSHEAAHGTAFRTRWLNEIVFWITSLVYMEEPLHRRHTHTSHHTRTWYSGQDYQMAVELPMKLKDWLLEISGFSVLKFHASALLQLATRRYSTMLLNVTPKEELPKMTRNARIFLAIYGLVAVLIFAGQTWLLWFVVLPRILGVPAMSLFTILQHAEVEANTPSILDNTRSFVSGSLGRFLYLNMNYHIEHHLYPQVPFHALPGLNEEIRDNIPEPDPGFFKTNLEVLSVVTRRSLGKNTKARSIRQAAMMTAGIHSAAKPRTAHEN